MQLDRQDLKVNSISSKHKLATLLQEMNSDFTEAEMLIDFVMVMIENQKGKDYVQEQLKDLLNEEESVRVCDWLFDYIRSNGRVDNGTQRVFDRAMAPIRDQDSHNRRRGGDREYQIQRRPERDLRSMLSKPTGGGVGKHTRRTEPYRKVEKVKAKCTYFPNCTRPDCPFFHPSEPCPIPNCTDLNCMYVHENEHTRKPQKQTHVAPVVAKCKFGANCQNPACTFSHPSPAQFAMQKAQAPCKFFPNCLNPQCPFSHPPPVAIQNNGNAIQEMNVEGPLDAAAGQITDPSQTICRFDPHCRRFNCHFYHPSRVPGSKNKVLIVNNENTSTSERAFALPTSGMDETMEVDNK